MSRETATANTPLVIRIQDKLGGSAVLGREVRSEADLAYLVMERLPLRVLAYVRHHGYFTDHEITTYVIPARTRRHREKRSEPLNVEESDRLVRLTRIKSLAEQTFEDDEKANHWLNTPLGIIGKQRPIELAKTDAGARLIEQLLAKIAWGAAA
jgi:putative toxin-antitoxin system antitoxin component (TIGR02293 family)